MIRYILLALICAAPVQAMTIEDCQRIKSSLSKLSGSTGEDIRLAASLTDDGWCRVVDGPLGPGLEWRATETGSNQILDFRQDRLELDDLGLFKLSGRVAIYDGRRLELGPVSVEARSGDRASVVASLAGPGLNDETQVSSLGLTEAALTVSGQHGLVSDILAWAFRLDRAAADSSLIVARDQRNEMLTWLENETRDLIDGPSSNAFREMVEAYPRARGVAEMSTRDDQAVQIGGLVSAVLFGTRLSRNDAAKLIEEAGLSFTWTPG